MLFPKKLLKIREHAGNSAACLPNSGMDGRPCFCLLCTAKFRPHGTAAIFMPRPLTGRQTVTKFKSGPTGGFAAPSFAARNLGGRSLERYLLSSVLKDDYKTPF